MEEVLRIVTNIGTPISLLAVISTLAFYAYSKNLKSAEKNLELLPEAERAKAVDTYLTRYGISGANLTREQKFQLIRAELEKRYRFMHSCVYVAALVFIVSLLAVVVAYIARPVAASELKNDGANQPFRDLDDSMGFIISEHPTAIPQRVNTATMAESGKTRNEERATFTFVFHNAGDNPLIITHAALFTKNVRIHDIKTIEKVLYPSIDHERHIAVKLKTPLDVNPHVVPLKSRVGPHSKATFTLWFQSTAGKGKSYIEFDGTLILYAFNRTVDFPVNVVIAPDSAEMHYNKE